MPSERGANPGTRSGRFDAWVVAGLVLWLVWGLRQHTFYKVDAHVYLLSILDGDRSHPHHMLFKPAVVGMHRLLATWSVSWFEAAALLSALGTALGVAGAHIGARGLGLSRAQAWLTSALVLAVPAVLFFGTVVEVHGPYFAFAGVAFVATAALARRPDLTRGAVLGGVAGLAYLGHASAALLLGVLLPTACYLGGGPATGRWRAFVAPGLVALAVQAAVVASLPALGRALGLGLDNAEAARYVLRDALAYAGDPARWATTLWFEWLLPYAPHHLVALALIAVRSWRPAALWLLAGVVPYYGLCLCLLPDPEFGAYLTPLAWPLALLVARALRAWAALVAAVGFSAGIGWVAAHDEPERAAAFARGVAEVAGQGTQPPLLLLGDHDDAKAFLIGLPEASHLLLPYAGAVPPAQVDAVMDQAAILIGNALDAGRAVLLTPGARAMLQQVVPSGPLVIPALAARFALEPVRATGPGAEFVGERVRRR